jgi:hypothetical protein
VIAHNRIFAPRGVEGDGGEGIAIEKGRGNLVARNVIVARAAGIRLGIDRPPIGGLRTVVRRNLVRGGGDDAFRVTKKRHSLLQGNIARSAGDDGFDVESRSTKLTSNRAVRNAEREEP